MISEFGVETLDEALARFDTPEIFNTDQGSQHGRQRALGRQCVHQAAVASVKYEDIYLHAYATPREVTMVLKRYFGFYNERRGHRNLDYQPPDEMYFAIGKTKKAA